jgi:HD-GYP domain-containing protein (c-di-GMP phosphodiesterase class II)
LHSSDAPYHGRTVRVTALRDLTERKQSEEKLKYSLDKLRRIIEGTIHALAITTEMRDPYTAGHQRRVSFLACAIALEMNLPEDRIEGIRMAGSIHDLGKICVPAEILSKPGRLSNIEFSIIKTHSQVGYDILKRIEFPWPIAQIVLQHHERVDGSGYPAGLTGAGIMLDAKIISVADVTEAMAFHRPYRPAHGIGKALEHVQQRAGVLYDTDVVTACMRVFAGKGFEFE